MSFHQWIKGIICTVKQEEPDLHVMVDRRVFMESETWYGDIRKIIQSLAYVHRVEYEEVEYHVCGATQYITFRVVGQRFSSDAFIQSLGKYNRDIFCIL